MIETMEFAPLFSEEEWKYLIATCVAPEDLVTRYTELFGDTYDGEPIVTTTFDGESATIQPVATDETDTLSILLALSIGGKPEQFQYSMCLTPEALRRSIDQMSGSLDRPIDFFDIVDHYSPALNRIRYAFGGVSTPETEAMQEKSSIRNIVAQAIQAALRQR